MQKNIISKFLLLLCFTSFLQATPLDDVFDVSPRIQALGGAGVALSEDASAAYYNPANLSRCLKNSVVLGYNLVSSNLRVFDKNGKVVPSTQVGNLNIGYLGACFPVWSKWNLGFYLSTPLEVPLELGDIETLNSTPRFFMYDASVKAPSAWVGLSFKPFKKLSVGLGATFSAGV
ncbi:hypothetical protein FJ364_05150, partial [Candidatus Dependentiae bacterium]|nr:hypothetical protein [Candidatus Dependentiae bacterium]